MKYNENSGDAANYLRQAIPLMVEHKIPPNPINYTLWYNYVAKKLPGLNASIDKEIGRAGTYDENYSELLYNDHILAEDLEDHKKALTSLTEMATTMLTQVNTSTAESDKFEASLSSNISKLESAKSLSDVKDIIDSVSSSTSDMQMATKQFHASLNTAHSEIESLKKELATTRQHAYYDQLTQLYNRHSFDKCLNEAIAENCENLCLIMADVDHFKSFNDQYGHIVGDKVLQAMGAVLNNNSPENGTPARYGGEEFALVLKNCELDKATQVAEHIRGKIEALQIKLRGSDDILDKITASFGVACYTSGECYEQLIERADQALYEAKNNGRNRVEIAA